MKYALTVLMLIPLVLTGCNTSPQQTDTTQEQTTPSQSLSADGPYSGTLPCTDCPGIETTLTLYYDANTKQPIKYFLNETYLGQTSPLSSQGRFTASNKDDQTIIQIEPDDTELTKYFLQVDTNTLRQLDREQKEYSDKSGNYNLKK